MATTQVRRVLCATEPRGSDQAVQRLLEAAEQRDVQAVALVGDLSAEHNRPASYRSLFRALGAARRPAYWIPGPGDAPVETYLREAQNIEVVHPFLHGVHGTAAFGPGSVLFAGFGGEVSDDSDVRRDEHERLRYPRWEAEYRLKLLRELSEHELVLLFAAVPAHKGRGIAGSEAIAELVNTYRPRLVVCGGGKRGSEMLGRSMVVAPGRLRDGHYAVVEPHSRRVELEAFTALA